MKGWTKESQHRNIKGWAKYKKKYRQIQKKKKGTNPQIRSKFKMLSFMLKKNA